MSFEAMIGASNASWTAAQGELAKVAALPKDATPQQVGEAMLRAQLMVSIATSVEQKASSAIDKAYQAHGQVASK